MFSKLLSLSIIITLVVLAIAIRVEGSPAGTTIIVNSTADNIADEGACTLREAVIAANNDVASGSISGECLAGDGVDKIILPSGVFQFSSGMPWSGGLDILESLTIVGQGIDVTIIDGNYVDRIFDIPDNGTIVNILKLTITEGAGYSETGGGGILNNGELTINSVLIKSNGNPVFTDSGGGILNFGTLNIFDSEIHSNLAAGGGGIANFDTITITNSQIHKNSARFSGGGINNLSGSITILDSSIDDNSARFDGGINNSGDLTILRSTVSNNKVDNFCAGINNSGGLILENITISGNEAIDYGGGICSSEGDAEISYTTITKNSADGGSEPGGGGLYAASGTVKLDNSILAANLSPDGPDCHSPVGVLVSSGYNLVGNPDGCNWTPSPGDVLGSPSTPMDPKLSPLTDNGGPTLTHALLSGSPAIDSANQETFPDNDQRGVLRPQGQHADRGSYEAIQLLIEDIQVSEITGGNTEALLNVNLSGNQTKAVEVNYKTLNGTAQAGSDYLSISGKLTFPVGTLSKSIKVTILPDLFKEAPEDFYIELSSETYSVILDKAGKVTIQDTSKWMQYLPIMMK